MKQTVWPGVCDCIMECTEVALCFNIFKCSFDATPCFKHLILHLSIQTVYHHKQVTLQDILEMIKVQPWKYSNLLTDDIVMPHAAAVGS